MQDGIQLAVTAVVGRAAQKRVLDDGVGDTGFAQFTAQSSIRFDGDTLVLTENTGLGVLEALGQSGNDCLLFSQDFVGGHSFHLRNSR